MLDLTPVSVPKAADVLAGILREKILEGDLQEGADLPNERDLGVQSGLSRASVREALRILEGEGLIATRTGRNGGSAVLRPSSATIERSVGIFIRGQRIRFEAVLETRAAIEPPSARFAALHRTDADIAEMERSHATLIRASHTGDVGAYVLANLDWHVRVVRASHNELLIAFISAIARGWWNVCRDFAPCRTQRQRYSEPSSLTNLHGPHPPPPNRRRSHALTRPLTRFLPAGPARSRSGTPDHP